MSQPQQKPIDLRRIASQLTNLDDVKASMDSALRREVRQRAIILTGDESTDPQVTLPAETERVMEAGAQAMEKIKEHGPDVTLSSDEKVGLEAVINAVGRPAILIKNDDFVKPLDPWDILEAERPTIRKQIPSVGRIERISDTVAKEVGTAFMVADGVVMTNRHVIEAIADQAPPGSGSSSWQLRAARQPQINFIAESGATKTLTFPIQEVVAVHGTHDLGLLRVGTQSLSTPGAPLPSPLRIASEPPSADEPKNVYVIGYPATDNEGLTPTDIMRRIFADIFEVKRLQPGNLTNTFNTGAFAHDCSTLGGNSGSCVIDMDTGLIVGLHYSGSYKKSNYAVSLWNLTQDPLLKDAQVLFD